MKRLLTAALLLGAWSTVHAQGPKTPPAPTIASVMETQLKLLENQFVPAAEAMPEEKYAFVPRDGDHAGVRTFGMEVKHVATANLVFYSAIIDQAPPAGVNLAGAANGPDEIQSKQQIIEYLKESFALGHRAFGALSDTNAVAPLAKPPISFMNTRLALAVFSLAHASDHYGQMVEYLRTNGITPPASRGQQPANPQRK